MAPNNRSNPLFAGFAVGVDAALADIGDVMPVGSPGESPERRRAMPASLVEHDSAAIILSPSGHSDPTRPGLARLRGETGGGRTTLARARLVARASSLARPTDAIPE